MGDLVRSAGRRDWAKLPLELLRLISKRVAEIGDYVRFGAVCKPWLSAASPAAELPSQVPWLLLPYHPDDTLRRFYSPSSGRTYRFDLPSSRGCVVYTSPTGWLLMADTSLSVSLFNPLTQVHIHLPPPTPSLMFFDLWLSARDQLASGKYDRLDTKTQLSATLSTFRFYPFVSSGAERIVALIVADSQFLYCRPHDTTWTPLDRASGTMMATVTYHRGRFYIVHRSREVAICEPSPEAKPVLIPSMRVPVGFDRCYLVAVEGELVLVTCSLDLAYEEPHFSCFKLDEVGEMKWSKIQDIGHNALFLTHTENVIAAVVDEAFGCRRNYLYTCGPLGILIPDERSYAIDVEDCNVEDIPPFEEEPPLMWRIAMLKIFLLLRRNLMLINCTLFGLCLLSVSNMLKLFPLRVHLYIRYNRNSAWVGLCQRGWPKLQENFLFLNQYS